jgi:2-dehydro-3-deoxygluconokinase
MMCENAEMPGKSLLTEKVKIYGPGFQVPYLTNYTDINLTFFCTNNYAERKIFDRWIEAIIPSDTNNVRFPKGATNSYLTNITITQYDETVNRIYATQLVDAFPIGIAPQPLSWSDDGRAGLYFVELSGSPRGVSVLYDRQGSAASQMSTLNTDLTLIKHCKLFHLSGITPALSSTCQQLCREALKSAKSAGVPISFDINYRSALWSKVDAEKEVSHLASLSSLVVCTSRDAEDLYGLSQDDENLAQKLSNRLSVSNVIVTQGLNGVSWVLDGRNGSTDAQIVETIDRVGAGDSFMAGVISGFLKGNIVEGIRRGQAMASLKRGIYGDHLVVAESEILDAMNGNNLEIRR